MLVRMGRNWDPQTLLVGIENDLAMVENSWEILQKVKHMTGSLAHTHNPSYTRD